MSPGDRLTETEFTEQIDLKNKAIHSDNTHETEDISDFESDFSSKDATFKHKIKHETTQDTSDFESELNAEVTDFEFIEVKEESEEHISEEKADIDTKKKYSNILQQKLKLNKNLDNRTRHKCTYSGCDKSFNRPGRLAIHIRTHTGDKPFKCGEPGCDKSYVRKQHLKAHIERNHVDKNKSTNFTCDICNQTFTLHSNMMRHKKRKHNNSRFKCLKCDAVFSNRQDRQRHIAKIHHNLVRCHICGKSMSNNELLKKHISTHKQHTCPHCSEVFVRWSDYQKHRRIHSNETVTCSICGKKVLQTRLKKHNELHGEMRDVIHCPVEDCPRFYFHYRNMKQHFITCHDGQTFPCTVSGCDKELSTEQKRNEHINKVHNSVAKKSVKPKKEPCERKDKGQFKKPMAAIITRLEVENSDTLLKQTEKVGLQDLDEIRAEGKQFVGSNVETSDSDSPVVGCGRAFVDMSEIKRNSWRQRNEELNKKVASIMAGKSKVSSLFNYLSSDTDDTDIDAAISNYNQPVSVPAQHQTKSHTNFFQFVKKS